MAVPFRQNLRIGSYLDQAPLEEHQVLPLHRRDRAALRVQPVVPGLRKDPTPHREFCATALRGGRLTAVEESGTPMVSIAGGEPLLHPQIAQIVSELIKRKIYVYLCTNAVLLERRLDKFTPSRYFSWVIHMDGLEERHDLAVNRYGVFQEAVSAIKAAKAKGFGYARTPPSLIPTRRRRSATCSTF